jgi:hypothetical protein
LKKAFPMRLNELQTRFKDMIFDGVTPDDFAAVFASNDTGLPERIDIYRNNVMTGVSNALISNFPLLEKLVGREFLDGMVRAYIKENPPTSGHLTFYGADFGDFVEKYEPAKNLAYLPDMARLEIAGNCAYHAQDDRALSVQELAAVPVQDLENIRLKLRYSVQLLKSPWPLEAIKDFCKGEGDAPDLSSGGTHLLIYRPRLEVQITKLTESQFEFLNKAKDRPLGTAVVEIIERYPDFDFPKTLQAFMTLEIFLQEPAKE